MRPLGRSRLDRHHHLEVSYATPVLGNNRGVLQNCTIDGSTLKKKDVAISYHKACECAAAGIIDPLKTEGEFNFTDICIKSTTLSVFHTHLNSMMAS